MPLKWQLIIKKKRKKINNFPPSFLTLRSLVAFLSFFQGKAKIECRWRQFSFFPFLFHQQDPISHQQCFICLILTCNLFFCLFIIFAHFIIIVNIFFSSLYFGCLSSSFFYHYVLREKDTTLWNYYSNIIILVWVKKKRVKYAN